MDRLLQRVAERGLTHLEEAQRVAHEQFVLLVSAVDLAAERRRGQPHLHTVEVLEDAAPLAIDAAVALVGDDQIKVARRVVPVNIDHALQRGHGDALFILEAPASPQHVAGVIGQVFVEGILGLLGQGDAVDQEQHAGDVVGLEQAFDEGRRGARLAGAGRHLDQQLAPAGVHLTAQGVDAFTLVVAAGNPGVDRLGQWIDPNLALGVAAFQVDLAEKARDLARIGLRSVVPEQDLVAIGQKDVGHVVQLLGIGAALRRGLLQVYRGALGLDHRCGPPVPVAEDIVSQGSVRQLVLVTHAVAIGQIPADIRQLGVDDDAGKGLFLSVGWGHALASLSCISRYPWPARLTPPARPEFP